MAATEEETSSDSGPLGDPYALDAPLREKLRAIRSLPAPADLPAGLGDVMRWSAQVQYASIVVGARLGYFRPPLTIRTAAIRFASEEARAHLRGTSFYKSFDISPEHLDCARVMREIAEELVDTVAPCDPAGVKLSIMASGTTGGSYRLRFGSIFRFRAVPPAPALPENTRIDSYSAIYWGNNKEDRVMLMTLLDPTMPAVNKKRTETNRRNRQKTTSDAPPAAPTRAPKTTAAPTAAEEEEEEELPPPPAPKKKPRPSPAAVAESSDEPPQEIPRATAGGADLCGSTMIANPNSAATGSEIASALIATMARANCPVKAIEVSTFKFIL